MGKTQDTPVAAVGRDQAAGVCLLVTDAVPATSTRDRLDAAASALDGFRLAQVDLEMRRTGDSLGAIQGGGTGARSRRRAVRSVPDLRLSGSASGVPGAGWST
jgi:ATP-dependent DNA helicase RecG